MSAEAPSASRRVLITGVSTHWGGRLAQDLEADPAIDVIIGVDRSPPKQELQRTEFVRVSDTHSLIRRIVQAAQIDTVVDTRLVVDSIVTSPQLAHENNVLGTLNVLAACAGPDSTVRKLVVKSSAHYYGCEQDDPAFFTEGMRRRHPPRTDIESDLLEAEASVGEFATRHPEVTVTVLRLANGIGPGLNTSHMALFDLPFVPGILGFDPRYQFIHADDIVGVLHHAVTRDLPGVYNGAADGVLVLSEIASLLGKPWVPVLPPWGTGTAAAALSRVGVRIPAEMRQLLRFGRAVDNRRLRATGYRYRYTTRETVLKLREHQRVTALLKGHEPPYRYEREVEDFLRWSPSVRAGTVGSGEEQSLRPTRAQLTELKRAIALLEAGEARPRGRTAALSSGASIGYDQLDPAELVPLLPTLDQDALERLLDHERDHAARPAVLDAITALIAART